MIQCVKNLGKDSCIRDMRTIPLQKIVNVMVGDHCDMKGIDGRGSRENRFPQDFFGDVQDRLLEGQERDARQHLESALSESVITIGRLIEHVLRRYEFVVLASLLPTTVVSTVAAPQRRPDHSVGSEGN